MDGCNNECMKLCCMSVDLYAYVGVGGISVCIVKPKQYLGNTDNVWIVTLNTQCDIDIPTTNDEDSATL